MHAGVREYPLVEAEPVPVPAAALDESIESNDEFVNMLDRGGRLAAIAAAAHPVSTGEEVVNNAIDEILALGRLKGRSVFDVMQVFPENVRRYCAAISGLPVTQVCVERLFSALKLLLADTRSRLKEDILQALLFLRIHGVKRRTYTLLFNFYVFVAVAYNFCATGLNIY